MLFCFLMFKGHQQPVPFVRILDIGAIFCNIEITITTSYMRAIVVDKPFLCNSILDC